MALRAETNFCNGFRVICPVQISKRKIFSFSSDPNQRLICVRPVPKEGRWPSSLTLGWDAVDATMSHALYARDERHSLRTAKSCGPDAPTLASSSCEDASLHGDDGDNKAGHRGEHEISRKTIAQGMPVETGEPVEDDRILCGHGCIGHPAFPAPSLGGSQAPSFFGADVTCKPRASAVARTRTHVSSSPRTRRRPSGCLKIESVLVGQKQKRRPELGGVWNSKCRGR